MCLTFGSGLLERALQRCGSAELNLTANVAILEGVAGDFFSNQRILGFHSVIDPHPGINVLMTLPADWNRQKGVRATEDILQAHGDKLDVIYAASNEMGIGATYAIEAAGLQDQIKVITNDGTPESVDMIRAGQILAETWHGFPEWGWYGTRRCHGCFGPRSTLSVRYQAAHHLRRKC